MISFRTNDGAQLVALNRSQAVAEFKPDGTVLSANQNFLDLLGYTLDEIEGRSHALLVSRSFETRPLTRASGTACAVANFKAANFVG